MKRIITTGLFLLSIYCVNGQNASDTIEVKQAMGVVFIQNGKKLKPRQLREIVSTNSEAYKEMKLARRNFDAGSVLGFAGGYLIGWPIGTEAAAGEPNWSLAAVGAGLIVVSIPFMISYSKHAKKAVELYNSGLKQSGLHSPELRLGFTNNGIGLRLTF